MFNNISRGVTSGQSQRSLQTADELRTMKKGTMLFVNASSPAAMLKTIAYFEDRKLARLADRPFEISLPSEREKEFKAADPVPNVMEPLSALTRKGNTE